MASKAVGNFRVKMTWRRNWPNGLEMALVLKLNGSNQHGRYSNRNHSNREENFHNVIFRKGHDGQIENFLGPSGVLYLVCYRYFSATILILTDNDISNTISQSVISVK